ncbi:MAG: alpha/beta hydrolase [Actinobacteria bacterium]|nr:alpha/beta hydrolase [Actinomycetota bacterium]MBO0834610.1 alpha/beta hydrolase [Actinomycetota bacterium]
MARWRRLSSAAGIAAGVAAAGLGAVIAAEKVAVGRIRVGPDPAADEPFGEVRGRPVQVTADDGVILHAEVSGADDALVTVVFCHGYCLSQDVWHYQRLSLGEDTRLVLWDLRGHGRSDRGDSQHANIDQLGADLGAVLAATVPGAGTVVLVGHSMGGMTIMALADQRPSLFGSQIAAVVLIATASHGVDATNWLPAAVRPAARYAGLALLRGASGGRRAVLTERLRAASGDLAFLATRSVAFGTELVSPAVVDFLERVIRATPIGVVADFYLALHEHDKRSALDTLGRVPVVVIAGEQDRLIPTATAAALATAIPGARLVTVPAAGHAVILERPDVVNQEIADLVKELQ